MERVKLGMVGLNHGYHVVCEMIEDPAIYQFIELVAVCDQDGNKAETIAKKHNIKKFYTSLDELLLDSEIQAVALFTGPVGRAKLIDKIISAGKDVLTTKPFESSASEAERVLIKAQHLGRVVHINSPTPEMTEDLKQISKWREQFHLGRPIAYRASTWCSYREQPDGRWYDDPQLCPVAPIFRLGIYLINDVSQFFGGVKDVHIFQSRIFTERPTADNAQLSILYHDGSIGNIFASFCVDSRQSYLYSLELNFERGTIYRNCGSGADYGKIILELSAKDESGHPVKECREFNITYGEYQYENFYKAVNRIQIQDEISIDSIVSAIQIIELLYKHSTF